MMNDPSDEWDGFMATARKEKKRKEKRRKERCSWLASKHGMDIGIYIRGRREGGAGV